MVKAESENMVSTFTYVTFLPDIYSESVVYCKDDGGLTKVVIPARTFDESVEVEIIKIPDRETPEFVIVPGRTREIKIYRVVNGFRVGEYQQLFKNNIKLIFSYKDEEYIEGMKILRWDDLQDKWQWEAKSKLNREEKYVYLETNKCSVFTLGNYLPKETKMYQNYPNPFILNKDKETSIVYDVKEPQHVSIKIYNINGDLVKVLVDKYHLSGRYHISWDGKNNLNNKVASGIYLCQMVTKNYKEIIKIAVIK